MSTQQDDLLERARRGDSAAIERLLADNERRLYRFGLRMCGSEDAAREVLQQTLLTAFRSLHAYRGDAQLSTWLYQIARSFCAKTRRRHVGEPSDTEALDAATAQSVPSPTASPEDAAHARELGAALEAAILALPESHREALVLRDVEGLSAEQAALVLGIEVANLKSRLHRARAQLRQHLATLLEPAGGGPGCAALAEELSDFIAQDVDKATCERIEQHLERCPECAAACDSLKKTVSLCRRLPGDDVPAPVRAAVRQALRGAISVNGGAG